MTLHLEKFCLLWLSFMMIGCGDARAGRESENQLGTFAIGSSPKDLSTLLTTDCLGAGADLSDCSGVGKDGIRYAFL